MSPPPRTHASVSSLPLKYGLNVLLISNEQNIPWDNRMSPPRAAVLLMS